MAHELDSSTGKVALALRGGAKSAWHGLGQEINAGDSLETIQRKGGLLWQAKAAALEYTDDAGNSRNFDGQQVIYRSDTGAPLGVTSSNRYHIVQPSEVLDFFRSFLGDNGLSIETAGAVRGGRIVWCMAKLGKDFDFIMPGKDVVNGYVRLQTSFDGTRATDLVATTIRQVCANTMRMVDVDADNDGFRTPHSAKFDAAGLQRAFGLVGEQYKMTSKLWNALVARKVSDAEATEYFCKLWGVDSGEIGKVDKKTGKKIVSTHAENCLQSLAAAYKSGPGASLKSANGTAFGLLNAVTYWVDHESRVMDKYEDGRNTARVASAWYGIGDRTKRDAEFLAAELAGCTELLQAA